MDRPLQNSPNDNWNVVVYYRPSEYNCESFELYDTNNYNDAISVLDEWNCENDLESRNYNGANYTCTLSCYYKTATEEVCDAKLDYSYTYDIIVVVCVFITYSTFTLYLLYRADQKYKN